MSYKVESTNIELFCATFSVATALFLLRCGQRVFTRDGKGCLWLLEPKERGDTFVATEVKPI